MAKKDSVCDSCTSKSENCEQTCEKKDQIKVKDNVKSVIAVMSGKGGVGKSTVSALLASSMAKNGRTAITIKWRGALLVSGHYYF